MRRHIKMRPGWWVMREAEKGEYDLRRVKRVVHACKRILEAKRLGGKQV